MGGLIPTRDESNGVFCELQQLDGTTGCAAVGELGEEQRGKTPAGGNPNAYCAARALSAIHLQVESGTLSWESWSCRRTGTEVLNPFTIGIHSCP